MRKVHALAAMLVAPTVAFAACSSAPEGSPTGSTSTGATSSQGSGSGGEQSVGGAGGVGTTAAATTGSSGGSGGAGGSGGGTTGGTGGAPVVDAGPPDVLPDVSFNYDAGPGDGAVSADSACAAEALAAKKLPIDIIWVIDRSGSMTEEIVQVKANINSQFADILAASNLDYQVLMITQKGTAALQVCVAPPLGGPNCGANPPLYRPIDVNVQSTDSLSLILSTYDNTNPAIKWSNSLRPEAVKVFIEVTDDNSSLAGATFDTQLLAKQPAGMFGTAAARKYVFHSIVGVSTGSPTVKCTTAVNTGAQYQVVSNLTGGLLFPVCSTDYSPIFQTIANGIVGSLACEFAVPKQSSMGAIDPENVALKFTPSSAPPVDVPRVMSLAQCAGPGWYYDDNAAPTKITLCPMTCSTVKADNGGKIDVLVGCLSG